MCLNNRAIDNPHPLDTANPDTPNHRAVRDLFAFVRKIDIGQVLAKAEAENSIRVVAISIAELTAGYSKPRAP